MILFKEIGHPCVQFCCTFETLMLYEILTEVLCLLLESSHFILDLSLYYFQSLKMTVPSMHLFRWRVFFFFPCVLC